MFSDPEKNISQLGVQPGQRIADIGSGSGFYALAAGRAVGPTGVVYAIDVQPELLNKLKNEAGRQHIESIQTIWGNAEEDGGTKLADASVESAIVANVMFQADDKPGLMKEAARILKRDGRLLFVEWSESFGGIGPQPESVVSEDQARTLAGGAGLIEERTIPAGSHHYGIIFKKQ